MAEATMSETDKKIVMKDHDLLIQLTTQMGDLIRRFDESNRIAAEQSKNIAVEMKGISLEQVRVSTEIKNLQNDHNDLERRMDSIETKSRNMDIISYILAAGAGFLAWFRQ